MTNLYQKSLGKKGEKLAAGYLQSQGLQIIQYNFHKRYSEIDIIAKEADTLVFIEVKTRIGTKFGTAEESITPWKKHQLIKSAYYYKLLHKNLPDAIRIDVVAVELDSDEKLLNIAWYKNITL